MTIGFFAYTFLPSLDIALPAVVGKVVVGSAPKVRSKTSGSRRSSWFYLHKVAPE